MCWGREPSTSGGNPHPEELRLTAVAKGAESILHKATPAEKRLALGCQKGDINMDEDGQVHGKPSRAPHNNKRHRRQAARAPLRASVAAPPTMEDLEVHKRLKNVLCERPGPKGGKHYRLIPQNIPLCRGQPSWSGWGGEEAQ